VLVLAAIVAGLLFGVGGTVSGLAPAGSSSAASLTTCSTTNGTKQLSLSTASISGYAVTINGVIIAAPGTELTGIDWNWGDGTVATGCIYFPESHTYANSGSFTVTVTATFSDGSQLQATQQVTVSSTESSIGQTQLIQELENYVGFFETPVDPQTGNQLPGNPYAGTVTALTSVLDAVQSETAGGQVLTDSELAELENVLNVVDLVIADVSNSNFESVQSIASSNDNASNGEFGIAYQVSLIIGERVVDVGNQLFSIGTSILTDNLGDYVNDQADSLLTDFTQNVPIQLDSILASETEYASGQLLGPLLQQISSYLTTSLDVENALAEEQAQLAHDVADYLTSLNGYEIDPFLADAIGLAENTSAVPTGSSSTISGDLSLLSAPANIAVETYDQLNALYNSGPLNAFIALVGLIPGIGQTFGTGFAVGKNVAEIGGDIGGNLVDLNYLYSPMGIPDTSAQLLDTLYYQWTVLENAYLGASIAAQNSQPAAISPLAVDNDDGCTGSLTAPTCQAGSEIGFSGTVTNSSGNPVADAVVSVSSTNGSPTAPAIMTNADGQFSDGINLPSAEGPVSITATAAGTSVSQTLSVTVGAGTLYALDLIGPNVIAAGSTSVPVEGIVVDQYDDPIPNVSVNLSSSVGSVAPSSTTTVASGALEGTFTATATIPSGTPSVTLTASVPGSFLSESVIAQVGTAPTVVLDPPSDSGLTCNVDGSAYATTSGTTISSVLWQWGDGTTTSSLSFPQSHNYSGAGTYTVTVTATDSNGSAGSLTTTCEVAPTSTPTLAITTTSLPTANIGTSYSATIAVSGGTSPYTFSSTGALPPGLAFFSPFVLSGTPDKGGVYTIDVSASDSSSPQQTVHSAITLTVEPTTGLAITTSSLPNGTEGDQYRAYILATGGVQPYSWSEPGSNTPPGLTFSQQGNELEISGSPGATGTYTIYVDLTDPDGDYTYKQYDVSIGSVAPIGIGNPPVVQVAPQSATDLTNIACSPNGQTASCWAVGSDSQGNGVIDYTDDAGASWTKEPTPSGLVSFSSVSCPQFDYCYASAGGDSGGTQVAVTTDGTHWSAVREIPDHFSAGAISCPTTQVCFVSSVGGGGQAIWETSDAGQTWTEFPTCYKCGNTVTDNFAFYPYDISCPTTSNCFSVGLFVGGGNEEVGVLSTTNGGDTWTLAELPPGAFPGGPLGITCSGATACWVSAEPSSQTQGDLYAAYTDDGSTWTLSSTPPGIGLDGGYSETHDLGCVSSSVCAISNVYLGDIFETTDGSDWTLASIPASVALATDDTTAGAACVSSGQCWFVTDNGAILSISLNGSPPADSPAQLSFTTVPVSGVDGTGNDIGPITITEEDASGDVISAPEGGTTVLLSSTSQGASFADYQNGPSTTTVTIPAGSSSVTFYYGDTAQGQPVITAASGPLLSAQQQESVSGEPIETVGFNSDGGAAVASLSGPGGSSVTLPSDTYTGYIFDGWFTHAKGGTEVGVGGSAYTIPMSGSTLYAQWTKKSSQRITFAAIGTKTLAASPLTVSATATSGQVVTFTTSTPTVCTASGTNGATITLLSAGTCTVYANQAGNTIYLAAPRVARNFKVTQVAQAITFGALAPATMAESPITVSATASSGLTVTFNTTTPTVCTFGGVNGATIALLKAGTCTVEATQNGDSVYKAAKAVKQRFKVT
jgi:hypothetical protein